MDVNCNKLLRLFLFCSGVYAILHYSTNSVLKDLMLLTILFIILDLYFPSVIIQNKIVSK